jgi:hypothetical protein
MSKFAGKRRHSLKNILFLTLVYFIRLVNVCLVSLWLGDICFNFLKKATFLMFSFFCYVRDMSEFAGNRRHALKIILFLTLIYFIRLVNVCLVSLWLGDICFNFLKKATFLMFSFFCYVRDMSEFAGKRRHALKIILSELLDNENNHLLIYVMFKIVFEVVFFWLCPRHV